MKEPCDAERLIVLGPGVGELSAEGATGARRSRRPRRAPRATALALALFQLRHLLEAGVPIDAALDALVRLEPGGRRRALWRAVGERVEAGSSLSEALAALPAGLDASALALLRAGEASGRLAAQLGELEAQLLWRQELRERARTATLYPLCALVALVAAVTFLLGAVLPSLAGFLAASGHAPPWHGRLLVGTSRLLGEHALALALALAAALALAVLAPRLGARAHRLRDRLILVSGPLGRTLCALAAARWARTTAALYGSGLTLDEALRVAEGTLGNRALVVELARAREMLLSGTSLGVALSACPSLPPTLVRLVAAGEAAGVLERSLRRAAELLQRSAEHAIARGEALLGPTLLAIAGLLMVWISVSVLAPLYEGATMAGLA